MTRHNLVAVERDTDHTGHEKAPSMSSSSAEGENRPTHTSEGETILTDSTKQMLAELSDDTRALVTEILERHTADIVGRFRYSTSLNDGITEHEWELPTATNSERFHYINFSPATGWSVSPYVEVDALGDVEFLRWFREVRILHEAFTHLVAEVTA